MDASAGSAAYLNGLEIINEGRTTAYLKAGYGPPGLVVNADCACPEIFRLAGCEDTPGQTAYVSPTADPAPWFDVSVPESADFAGFYPTAFEGLGSTFTRKTTKKINGGSVLGKRIAEERIITWRGFLFGRTCCAVQFGLRWLIDALSGSGCPCEVEELDLLVCCPKDPGIILTSDCSVLPSVQFSNPCSGEIGGPAFDAFRTLRNVALVEGPNILSERKTGCGGGCSQDNCPAESCIVEVEFSFVAGTPFLYGCPVPVCVKQPWVIEPTEACEPGSILVGKGPQQTITVSDEDCPKDCDDTVSCGDDPFCPLPSLPVPGTVTTACKDCRPLSPVTQCCYIENDNFGTFFDGVAVIEIFAGKSALRNTHIRFLNNPLERPCEDVDSECNQCDELHIRYIPPDGTLVIDGLTQSIKLKCPGDEEGSPADHLVGSPFSWSTLECIDMCICIETDSVYIDETTAHVSVSIVPSQM